MELLLGAAAIAAIAAALVAWASSRRWRMRALGLEADVGAVSEGQAATVAAARAEVARFEAAIGAISSIGIVVCDDAGQVVLRNDLAAALLDDPAGGALVASAVERVLTSALQSPPPDPAEEPVDLFGPPRRSVVVSATPLADHDGGAPIGVLVVIDDVSERRHVDAVRRDFVANVSHELRTPVGALALLAETMSDEPDPDVARRLAERMQLEATRVNRIIEDLLDLSRIETEEVERREPVRVDDVVAEATDRLRSAADQRDVDLQVVAASTEVRVLGDRRQLVSAVHSLLENAITYTEPGGRVLVNVEAPATVASVRIIVDDTGVGIPARDLDRIFERFYRVDRARARATGGTGLGLSIVRHVAQNHGGTVSVRSREGVGSTFILELPRPQEAPA